ncbi:MAG TPA: hypothetical protein VKA60_22240 [Blastocatellia bacterium]|nr:hypothetical protein [Blastocatellia bacterium]
MISRELKNYERLTRVRDFGLTHAAAIPAGSRAALQRLLEIINRTARGMSVTQPGLGEQFRMPLGSGDQALLTGARAFHANATPLKQQFIDNDLPADFLTQLAAEIEEFEQALTDKHQHRDSRVTATAAKEAAFERGLNALRQLDPVMRNRFDGDPVMLAAWESASHAARPSRPPSSEQPPAQPSNP